MFVAVLIQQNLALPQSQTRFENAYLAKCGPARFDKKSNPVQPCCLCMNFTRFQLYICIN